MRYKITNLVFLLALFYFSDSKAQLPIINSFSPKVGTVGTLISIQGSSLDKVNSISIHGKPALIISLSSSSITAYVMPGCESGIISVSAPAGTTNSGEK